MRQLPLFEQINEDVKAATGTVVLTDNSLPMDGLDILQDHHLCIILRYKSYLEKFQLLGYTICDICEFYIGYILPYINVLPDATIYKHMYFISNLSLICPDNLYSCLAKVNFIPGKDGNRKKCMDLYDPDNELFKLMLEETDFPSEPYNDSTWLVFLRKVGLIVHINCEIFLKFAKMLTCEENEEKLSKASELLCMTLFSQDELMESYFLSRIKSMPFPISERMSRELEVICCSRNSQVKRICFENSSLKTDQNLIWTAKNVLPSCIHASRFNPSWNSTKPSWKAVLSSLGIIPVGTTDVLTNMKNITARFITIKSTTCKVIDENLRDKMFSILQDFYNYLQKSSCYMEESNLKCIRALSCILVNENRRLEVPEKTVLMEEGTLPPYLNFASVKLGQYFELFESLGCSKRPMAIHYIKVLSELRSVVKDKILNPNEIITVRKAVCYLSSVLKDDSKRTVSSIIKNEYHPLKGLLLYLPTVTFDKREEIRLNLSKDVIYIDDFHI